MKKKTGIWIDSAKAIIVTLEEDNAIVEEVNSGLENRIYHDKESDKGSFSGSQHISNDGKFQERKKQQLKKFVQDVSSRINNHDEIFIFGPAETKTVLKKYLEQDQQQSKKLKAVESVDSMSLNQITAKVKKFFS